MKVYIVKVGDKYVSRSVPVGFMQNETYLHSSVVFVNIFITKAAAEEFDFWKDAVVHEIEVP